MRKLIFLSVIIFSVFSCKAQDADKPPRTNMHEIGLNVTQMFSTLSGGNANSELVGPYFFTYKNIPSGGTTFRLGLGAEMEQSGAPDSERKTNDYGFDIRMGYEKQWQVAPKWITYVGQDFLGGFHNIRTKNSDFTTSSRDWNIGTGPIFGVQWMLSPQVGLSTETALYYRYTEFISQVKANSGGAQFDSKDKSHANNVDFILPTSLFLSVRF